MDAVTDGVVQIHRQVNSFIIDGDEGVTLVDAGYPKQADAIVEALDRLGRSLDDVTTLIITHGHADHYGGAAVLARGSGATVVASSVDAPVIEGARSDPPPPVFERFPFLKPILRIMPDVEHLPVTHTVTEGPLAVAEDLRVVATPGHTDGHISLLLERGGGVLFVGDAATRNRRGEVRRGFMNRQEKVFDASLQRLATLTFDTAVFGHSAPLTGNASAAFQRYAATL